MDVVGSALAGVKRIGFAILRSVLGTWDIQIHHNGLLTAAHDHGLDRLVLASVQLLMRNVRRYVNEISRTRFIDELKMIAPTKTRAATHHVDHGFEFPMMMRTGLRIGMHDDRPGPELLRADSGIRNRFGAVHTRRLRRVGIK